MHLKRKTVTMQSLYYQFIQFFQRRRKSKFIFIQISKKQILTWPNKIYGPNLELGIPVWHCCSGHFICCFNFKQNNQQVVDLSQRLANLFCKGTDRKYTRLCGTYGLCHNNSCALLMVGIHSEKWIPTQFHCCANITGCT